MLPTKEYLIELNHVKRMSRDEIAVALGMKWYDVCNLFKSMGTKCLNFTPAFNELIAAIPRHEFVAVVEDKKVVAAVVKHFGITTTEFNNLMAYYDVVKPLSSIEEKTAIYKNADWINEHYVEAGANVSDVVKEIGIDVSTFKSWLRDLGIEYKTRKTNFKAAGDRLSDAEWLRREHHVNRKSATAIAKELGVYLTTVTKALDKAGVVRIDYSKVDDSVLAYKDKAWLTEQHHTNKLSLMHIARELIGVSDNVVKAWFEEFGIEHINYSNVVDIVVEESELHDLYVTQKLTVPEVADRLQVTSYQIDVAMKHYGIEKRRLYKQSAAEREISEYVKSLGVDVIENDRTVLNGFELDVYAGDNCFAIEYNGLPWHCEWFGNKTLTYHRDKTNAAIAAGVSLMHVNSVDWKDKPDIVKSMIRHRLGKSTRLYARSCETVELDSKVSNAFMTANHMKSYRNNESYRIGLTYKGDLVAAMTFSKHKKHGWELSRFATVLNTVVVGGATKLFSAFVAAKSPDEVLTYVDRSISEGGVYAHMGFAYAYTTKPGYAYYKNDKLFSRQTFMKTKLASRLETYDPNMTERENMRANKYDVYWDSGNHALLYKK